MTQTVQINGVDYAPVDRSGERRMIVIADNRGLTLVGDVDLSGDSERIVIRDAKCVIRWGTTKHIAELADGPTDKTLLGVARDIEVFRRHIVAAYECGDGWA